MGEVASRLSLGLTKMFQRAGTQISVTYFTATIGSIYDEATSLSVSGTKLWTSGIVFPLDPQSATDSILLQQGKLSDNDLKLYTHGSLLLTPVIGSTTLYTQVGIGSPGSMFSVIPLGGVSQQAEGIPIFKRIYLKKLKNGSLLAL